MSPENAQQEPVAIEENAGTETPQAESEALNLDSLLQEYEPKDESSAPAEQPAEATQPAPRTDPKIEAFMNDYMAKQAHESVEKATDMLLESAGIDVDRDLALGFLQVEASRDPRLVQAYQNMNSNPEGFKRVMQALAPKLKEKFKQPDAKKTADSQAARAAVKGQDTQVTDKPNAPSRSQLAAMSDAELEAHTLAAMRGEV